MLSLIEMETTVTCVEVTSLSKTDTLGGGFSRSESSHEIKFWTLQGKFSRAKQDQNVRLRSVVCCK